MLISSHRRFLLLCSFGVLASLLTGYVGAPNSSKEDVQLIAHRGCADMYPENTVLAVQKSAPYVEMIEIDIQRCGSGEIVVFHDDQLDRLTDATGSVSTMDWKILKGLTIQNSEQTIPRLVDMLAAVSSDRTFNIELKHTGMAEDVLSIVKNFDNEILYSSFSAEALQELGELDGDAPLAYVIASTPDIGCVMAEYVGCIAVHPDYNLVLETDFVEQAHEDGFEVNVWTIADIDTTMKLVEAGVDGIFVDRWDVL